MNVKQAMWSSFYDDIDKITQIVRGAHAMDSDLVVLIEFHYSEHGTARVSLFDDEQYTNYLQGEESA